MKYIKKVKLHNFRRFKDFEVELNAGLNIFIGENEAGKSSILSAINLVLSGSKSQFEKIGIEKLLNSEEVEDFLKSDKKYENLPKLYVELWLNEQEKYQLNGNQNSERLVHDGLCMECTPIEELSSEINEILQEEGTNFPFEYYSVKFSTFSGDLYTGYKKHLKHIVIDTAQIGNEYAIREYIGNMYRAYVSGSEKNKYEYEYRKQKEFFKTNVLCELNKKIEGYSFAVRSDIKANLQTDLTLLEDGIGIDNKGKGKQCFIKTEFALKKAESAQNKIDIVLIEEPENHLSHINMKKLIKMIRSSDDKQLIIATHSNFISSRLDLRKTIMLHRDSTVPLLLNQLPNNTAKFFIKAPDQGILNFILSNKVILVEGDSEYMLMESFYQLIKGTSIEDGNAHVISVGGTSFKRYLDIAKLLNIKVAVIRDNDGDYQSNCFDRYSEYVNETTKIFYDNDNGRNTFEVCIYKDNKELCDSIFKTPNRKLSIQEYMLKNKAESAFSLLDSKKDIAVPLYIREAIEWISV